MLGYYFFDQLFEWEFNTRLDLIRERRGCGRFFLLSPFLFARLLFLAAHWLLWRNRFVWSVDDVVDFLLRLGQRSFRSFLLSPFVLPAWNGGPAVRVNDGRWVMLLLLRLVLFERAIGGGSNFLQRACRLRCRSSFLLLSCLQVGGGESRSSPC